MSGPIKSQVASSTPFNNSTNGFIATNVQDAIEELNTSINESITCTTMGYSGTANSGRWLEVVTNNPSNNTPLVIAGTKVFNSMSLSVDTTNTGTVTIYKNGSSVATISITTAKKNTVTNLNITYNNLDELSAQCTSGTLSRPIVGIWG